MIRRFVMKMQIVGMTACIRLHSTFIEQALVLPTHTTRARMTVVYAPAAGKVCFRERPPFRVTFTTIASMNIGSLHWNAGSHRSPHSESRGRNACYP